MNKIKVLIIDDHPTSISGIEKQLGADDRFEIIGSVAESATSASTDPLYAADVLLLEINAPQPYGIELLPLLKNSGFLGKIIIHSSEDSDELIEDSRKRGADGFILKCDNLDRLKEIIIQVEAGQKIFPN